MGESLAEMAATWPFGVFVLLLGLCVGSFLNVCIYRLPAGKSLIRPGSHCTACLRPIAWYDNLPIASYVILRGRCRQCGQAFSVRYLVIEALTGLVFFGYWAAYFRLGLRAGADHGAVYAVHMVLVAALVVSGAIDFERKEIYTSVTNVALAVGVVGSFVWPRVQVVGAYDHALPDWVGWARADAVILALIGTAVGAGLILVTRTVGTWVFRKEAMGLGDAYLMAAVGGVLGWEATVIVFMAAPFLGLAYGLWRLARKKDHEVPYGPFLGAAAGVAMVIQDPIVAYFRPGLAGVWNLIVG